MTRRQVHSAALRSSHLLQFSVCSSVPAAHSYCSSVPATHSFCHSSTRGQFQ
jgi:hypothetical protein